MITYGVIAVRDLGNEPYDNYSHVSAVLGSFGDIKRLIYGGGAGTDSLVARYVTEKGIPYRVESPDLPKPDELTGKRPTDGRLIKMAFTKRNAVIVDRSDALIIFWDSENLMVQEAMKTANRKLKPMYVFPMVPRRR